MILQGELYSRGASSNILSKIKTTAEHGVVDRARPLSRHARFANGSVLHISHTDIRCDSRILKELRALENIGLYKCVGIGVKLDEGASFDLRSLQAKIITLHLFSNFFRWLPRPILYALNMLELGFRIFFRGLFVKPLVVHCHDTMVLPACVLIKLFTGCKLIYDAHELESNKKGQSWALAKGTLFIERLSWRWIDRLVSVSDSILSWYENNLGSKESVLVLNSPDLGGNNASGMFAADQDKYFHQLYAISKDKLVFVYLGILSTGRGIEATLETFTSPLIEAHVVFVGYGDLSQQIQEYSGKHANIHLHKPVPHDQVVALVKSADVGLCLIENVSLSDFFCLPNKLFEYSFAGLYTLASDFPEIKTMVKQYSLGTCCEPNPNEIREAIQALINNPPGRVKADLSSLGWGAQAERLVQGYRKMLDSGSSNASVNLLALSMFLIFDKLSIGT